MGISRGREWRATLGSRGWVSRVSYDVAFVVDRPGGPESANGGTPPNDIVRWNTVYRELPRIISAIFHP